jgi:hypothetical protein
VDKGKTARIVVQTKTRKNVIFVGTIKVSTTSKDGIVEKQERGPGIGTQVWYRVLG